MTSPALRRRSVDDYLGPPGGRFFSAATAASAMSSARSWRSVTGCAGSSLSARVGLSYPGDWSRKSAGVTLARTSAPWTPSCWASSSAKVCAGAGLLPGPTAAAAHVGALRHHRRGSAPEEELAQVPAQARLTRTAADGDGLVSVVTSQVGAMRVRCEVAHATGPVVAASRSYARLTDVLGPADPLLRQWVQPGRAAHRGSHRRRRRRNANASVMVLPADAADQGIEGAYPPFAATPVDCFVTGLQLAQILLYGLDGMTRAASDTLWMRSTAIDIARPGPPGYRPAPPDHRPARRQPAHDDRRQVAYRRHPCVAGRHRGHLRGDPPAARP